MAFQLAQVMPRGIQGAPAAAAFFQIEQGYFDPSLSFLICLGFDKDMLESPLVS